jgi:amino acid adenylation domain-containing protein
MSIIPKPNANLAADEKRALLAQLLREKAKESKSLFPLSQGQQALWFLYKLVPHSWAYNTLFTARIQSAIDIPALRRTFQALISRHPSLRTTYTERDGKPFQQIHEDLEVQIEEIDVSNASWDELKEQVTQEARRPFNLEQGSVMRVSLFTRSPKDHIFMLAIHHIASDFWSLLILMDELRVLYSTEKTGTQASLPPQNLSYVDYIHWQNQMLAGAAGERLWAYWREQLAGELPVLNLPTDRPRSPVQTYQGASHSFRLTKELTQRLKGLAQAEKATLYMTLLAAFQVLLYRYTGQEDILVGSPTFGRTQREFAEIVGYFVNPVVLRANLAGNPTFQAFLSQVRQTVLGAIGHQDYPFPLLVERLQADRDPTRSPIFQVLFILQKPQQFEEVVELFAPSETPSQVNWGELKLEPFEIPQQEGQFDLTLEMIEAGESLFGVFKYNTDLFEADTITRMSGHFQTLLEAIVTNPHQPVSQFPLLSEAEQHQLLVEWNDTQVDYPKDLCVHQLFEAQSAQTPEAVAVEFEGQQLTYRELNDRANQVAHHLRSLGVGPDGLVGICVERSLEMVIGLLGILKAGGAYVPLDPSYPQERLAFMLEDAQVPILLTQQQLVEKLPENQARVICLDTDWEVLTPQSEENPLSEVMADHLAYVMYTSGSTGRPKGVSVIHRGVMRLVKQANYASFTAEEVFLQLAPISFDASTFEIWGSLLNGARLVVMPPHTPSLQELGQAIEQYQVTTLWLTAGLFHLMVDEQIEDLKGVRQLLAGGDVLSVGHVKKVLEEITGLRLINGYGPTENTTFTCCYPITEPSLVGISVPIGRPIANTQVYLLDDHLQPVPVGVPGELYIGGDGLARGYLNRSELTAERFILNPFSNEPGARLYKTGDLACYQPDGNIEFLGRLDDQVKIRGFRIELGEIEAVLSQHPVVQQSVVVVREDIPGNQQLVAYLVPDKEQARLTVSELRQFLKQQLPEYMAPSAFVTLDSLPLTPNGKVDRRALPGLQMARLEVETTLVAPRTPIEEILALIWTDILGVKQVGIHDNFFELGGHSLLATQVISRVRSTLAVELPLSSLFKNPTVIGLAECVETALSVGQSIVAPPLLPIARSVEMPLSFAQARLWFLDQLEPGNAFYNIPAAVRLSGQLNLAALEQSLNQIISRHEALRTNFVTVNGQPVQVIASTLTLTVPVVDLRQVPESELERDCQRLANEEAVQPFDLATEPLVRTKLLQLSESEHVLLLTMHHIVSDGWSMGVLVRELAALYEAFCNDSLLVLPELPIQYPDFAVWQQQWLQAEVLESQLGYWKQQLDGASALLELPTDRPRLAVQTFRGAHQSFALSKEVTEALITLSQRQGATLFMTLLAAFEILLHRYTGQADICVGTPIANRNRAEIEGLIGLFVNTLVLRTDMSGNPSFEDVLSRVRDVALEAYAHQDLPFEQLVEALQPSRDLSHTPLFQVMFVLENAPMPSLKLQGLTLSLLEVESATAKFDLTLSLENSEQGLIGSWEYNTDLFDAATITRIAGHYETLLEAIVTNPQQQVSQFPLLSEAERHQLLVEWNDTQVNYPTDVCIHQLFEAQVERTPDAVAVVFEDEQLTYGELNRRANQLAHHLRSLGVGPDVLVGISLERSLEMVIGLLGILKAGGAYVPLDPEYPTERLAYMLSDSQVSVLLTQSKLADSFPEHGAQVVYLNKDWGVISRQSQENPVRSVKSSNLAYTIYTSGSTGKPKGVMISHKAISNHMCWMQTAFPLTDADKVLQKTPFSFDASIWEFYAPLLAGAQLVMARPGGHRDSAYLIEVITELKVTTVQLVPSLLQMLLESEKFKMCKSLKRVFCGGEALPMEYIKRFSRHLDADLHNLYGPTEATIDVIFFTCKSESHQQLVPIGRPIANTQIYILDGYLQPVGVGVAGELYIGGDGLARGYLNRPDLTAEKFISNPFSDEPRARLYKTGDRARYLSDGNIEFLGRLDDQVKIRGFRIELGEIEAVLGQHPAVEETVVMVREDVPGNKRLVAYVVVNQTSAPTVSQLHQFLKQKLPEYMIPSAIVKLEALPLTPNGKVDRRALLATDTARPELQSIFVAPRDTLELQLAQIWEDVLNVRPIGVTDNFFTLGGHSLLAVRLIALLQQQFGQNLPLATLFLAPTIEHLASALGQPTNEQQWSPLVKIQPGGSKRPFFCVPGSGGNVIYFYHLARHLGSDQPFYGLQARGLDGEQMPHTQVEDMAAYYIEALQTVQPQGPYFLGGHSFGSYVAFEMALQLLHQGQEVALLAILDTPAPLPTNKPGEVEHYDDARLLTDVAMTIEQLVGKKLSVSYEDLQPLAPDEQLNYIMERLKTVNFFPPEAKLSQLRGLVQVFKANHQTHYVPHEVYPNQITVFPASEQFCDDPAMGWDQVSSEPVETYSVPGDHITMVTEPHVQVLAEKLRACLDKAQADDERK